MQLLMKYENATKIQNKWRENNAKQKAKDLKTADKYMNLVKMIKTKHLLDIISKIKEDKIKTTKQKKGIYPFLLFNIKA